MAWWKTGEGDDVLGDAVIDVAAAALARQCAPDGRSFPGGLPAWLRTWQDALNAELRSLTSESDVMAVTLTAEAQTSDAARASTLPVFAASTPSSLPARRIALEALRQIARTYRDATDRLPRRSELARCLAFTIASLPDDHSLAQPRLRRGSLTLRPYSGPITS